MASPDSLLSLIGNRAHIIAVRGMLVVLIATGLGVLYNRASPNGLPLKRTTGSSSPETTFSSPEVETPHGRAAPGVSGAGIKNETVKVILIRRPDAESGIPGKEKGQ